MKALDWTSTTCTVLKRVRFLAFVMYLCGQRKVKKGVFSGQRNRRHNEEDWFDKHWRCDVTLYYGLNS